MSSPPRTPTIPKTPQRHFNDNANGFVFEKDVRDQFSKDAPDLLQGCDFGPFDSKKIPKGNHEIDVFGIMKDDETDRLKCHEAYCLPDVKIGWSHEQKAADKFPEGEFYTIIIDKKSVSWPSNLPPTNIYEAAKSTTASKNRTTRKFVQNDFSRKPYDSVYLKGCPLDPLYEVVLVKINGFVIKDCATAVNLIEATEKSLELVFFQPKQVVSDPIPGALLLLKQKHPEEYAGAIEILSAIVTKIENGELHYVDPKDITFNDYLGNQEGHECMLALGFVTEKQPGKDEHKDEEKKGDCAEYKEFDEEVRFKADKGHCRVPVKKGGVLGKWIDRVRKKYKRLKPVRVENNNHEGAKPPSPPPPPFDDEVRYRFSQEKLETLKYAKETIMAALSIRDSENIDWKTHRGGKGVNRKHSTEIVNHHHSGYVYPKAGIRSLIASSPNAKKIPRYLMSDEMTPLKVVIGEAYSGDSGISVQAKVLQLERNIKEYCERCQNRSRDVQDAELNELVTSIVGLALLHFNGCGQRRKISMQFFKEQVGKALSPKKTPLLWRMRLSERFLIHVVSSSEAPQTYENMFIHNELSTLSTKMSNLSTHVAWIFLGVVVLTLIVVPILVILLGHVWELERLLKK